MEGFIKEVSNKLDNMLTTKVNQLKFSSFSGYFGVTGKGVIKSITGIANNGQSATVNITVDNKYKTGFTIGPNTFRQSQLGYSLAATLNEPICFNTSLRIDAESNFEGYVIYKIEE